SDPRMEGRLRDVSDKRRRRYELMPTFTWQENLVIGWAGMRGVVTLAAAAGIPLATGGGEAFPGRDLIQALAFAVAIGTLLLQGLTLPWLVRRLKISDPHEAERREQQHRVADQVGH